jgi:cell division protein FtsW (lipid II flippase)
MSATLLGLLYLRAAGAPTSHLIVNALALVMGLALFAVIPQSTQGSRAAGGVVLALGVMLLATAMFGVSIEGASRWVRVGGVSLQISLVVLPALLVLFARSSGFLATTGVVLAALGLGLQPDRAMAGIMAAALAVLALYRQERQVVLALTVAGVSFTVTLLRPDSLPAVPYVDQILYTSFEVHPLAGIAVLGGALLLIVPALAGFWMDSTNRAAHAVFGLVWLGMAVAAALGNYPTPVVGYGGSAILGYALSLSFMPVEARSTAVAEARSQVSTRTDTTGSADLRVRVELGPRSTEHLYPSGA